MNNNDTQTLELQLKSTGEKCLTIIDKLVDSLTKLEKATDKTADSIGQMSKVSDGVKDINQQSTNATKNVNKLGRALKDAFNFQGIKRLTIKAMDFFDEATNRAEELNLFNVIFKNISKNGEDTFSDLGKAATRFQNQLNETFGTNKTETLRYQGLFQAMATNVGISDKYAAIMSENMTKMTYDLASLYNRSEQTTAEALRGGVYAGQTKPLRGYGIDVTQNSLKPVLSELGIYDRSISQMNQAEKEILRYIAVLRQAKSAMGDFADTIESPANQLKILKNQVIEAKTAVGNLFMGIYANVLPYANAFLMVIKEVAKAIAKLFGIKTRDYNTGISSMAEAYEDIEEGAGGAAEAVKELKRQVLGFDQIHNLTTDNSGSGGYGAGVSGGIDQRLLDAISEYDNLMGNVKMRATEIRDEIMEWLGFSKKVNEETQETYFEFDHLTGGTLVAALGVAGSLALALAKVFNIFKGIGALLPSKEGIFAKFLNKQAITSTISSLSKALGVSSGTLAAIGASVAFAVGSVIHAYNTSDEFKEKVDNTVKTVISTLKDLYNTISEITNKIWEVIKPIWDIIVEFVSGAVKILYSFVIKNFSDIADKVTGVFKIISDVIHGDLGQAFEDAKTMVGNLWENWKEHLGNIFNFFVEIGGKIFDKIKEFIPKALEKLGELLTWVSKLPDKFFYYAGEAVGWLWKTITETDWLELGKKVLNGIVDGIKNIGSALWNFGSNLFSKIWESIKNIDWAQLGKNILNGIVEGLFNIGSKLYSWGSSFLNGIKNALSGSSSGGSRAIGGVYTSSGWKDIPQYASGGAPSHGTIFAAGENGAEIVSNINRRTEVLNRSQIASSIYSAVLSAMSQVDIGGGEVHLYAHTDEGVVIDRINQKTKQTGRCPINIPA